MNASLPRNSERTLTVFCPLGLSNRLRVLLSGLALAEATGRQFTMLWPITPACAAPFADLFASNWPVQTVDAPAVARLPYISGWFGHLPDLLTAEEPHVTVGHPGWLIRPGQHPSHDRQMVRCQALFAELEPIAPIMAAVGAFRRSHFRPTMIGVHLRRGDLLGQRPDAAGNTIQACDATDQFLRASPGAGILLCTDDGAVAPHSGRMTRSEGLQDFFRRRYGSQVVWTTPRSLDRRTPQAIQDAVVDLWLLRATDYFVGSQASSFSEMAVFGRSIPKIMVGGATRSYQWLERMISLTGLEKAIRFLHKSREVSQVPEPVLVRHFVTTPYRWMQRWMRNRI